MNFSKSSKALIFFLITATVSISLILIYNFNFAKVEKNTGKYQFIKYSEYKDDLGDFSSLNVEDLLVIADSNGEIVNFEFEVQKGGSDKDRTYDWAYRPQDMEKIHKLIEANDKTKTYIVKVNNQLSTFWGR